MIFSTRDIIFQRNGTATINIHGTKNDTDRSGFQVERELTTDAAINPVKALHVYISKTNHICPMDSSPLLLPLKPPYQAKV